MTEKVVADLRDLESCVTILKRMVEEQEGSINTVLASVETTDTVIEDSITDISLAEQYDNQMFNRKIKLGAFSAGGLILGSAGFFLGVIPGVITTAVLTGVGAISSQLL